MGIQEFLVGQDIVDIVANKVFQAIQASMAHLVLVAFQVLMELMVHQVIVDIQAIQVQQAHKD